MAANRDLRVRVRDGCRGGREQFTWNSIKEQTFKDREQYLGQSTKVGMMGKFGRYYLHDWYARKRDTAESIASEQESVQAYEDELMQEALGLKPKKLLLSKRQLTPEEFEELMKQDKQKSGEQISDGKRGLIGKQKKIENNKLGEDVEAEEERGNMMGERTAGLGFAAHRSAKLEAMKAGTLGTSGELQGSKSRMESIMAKYKPHDAAKAEGDDVKNEVKIEVKEEGADITKRPHGIESGGSSSSRPAKKPKTEVKEEEVDNDLQDKDNLRGGEKKVLDKEIKTDDAERKRLKKLKKQEKKLKKKEKKLAKKVKKEAKKAKKRKTKDTEELKRHAAKSEGSESSSSSSSS